jgi:hypothetical protein
MREPGLELVAVAQLVVFLVQRDEIEACLVSGEPHRDPRLSIAASDGNGDAAMVSSFVTKPRMTRAEQTVEHVPRPRALLAFGLTVSARDVPGLSWHGEQIVVLKLRRPLSAAARHLDRYVNTDRVRRSQALLEHGTAVVRLEIPVRGKRQVGVTALPVLRVVRVVEIFRVGVSKM